MKLIIVWSWKKQGVEAIKPVTGVADDNARAIISFIGTDIHRFPTDAHIASLTVLCPWNNESTWKNQKH